MAGTRNTNLDILRVVAVTMVILSHLPAAPRDASPVVVAVADWFRQYGSLGVDLFFVLSGFLVSGLLFREYAAKGRTDIRRFLIRRGFKIYPSFYLFALLTISLRIHNGEPLHRYNILSELLFVQNYAGHVWTHTWSLAVEEHFYVLLAALVALLCRVAPTNPLRYIPRSFWITASLVFVARAITFYTLPYDTSTTHRFPSHLQIDALFFGVLLSYYYQARPAFAIAARRHAWLIGGAAAVALVAVPLLPTLSLFYMGGHVLTMGGFGAIVLLAVLLPQGSGRTTRLLATIGAQSYSIYLWHAAVMAFGMIYMPHLLGHHSSFYETLAWYVPGSFALGIVMAKCIEIPALAVRERFFPDRTRTASDAASVLPISTSPSPAILVR